MENLDKKSCGCGPEMGCGIMAGHMCHHGKHHLVKMILKIIIIILIFWCGFKLGEITGSIRAEGGRMNRNDFRTIQNYSNTLPAVNPTAPAPLQ